MSAKEYTWEELKEHEKERSIVLRFIDQTHYHQVLLHWRGTCLRVLFLDPLFWLVIVIFVCFIIFGDKITDTDKWSDIDIKTVGFFLSFFLTLFVNQVNSKFNKLHTHSMKCKGAIADVSVVAASVMDKEDAIRLLRHMNAAHLAGYVGLSPTYSFDNLFRPVNEKHEMLTSEELDRLKEIDMDEKGEYCWELIVWCLKDVKIALDGNRLDLGRTNLVRGKILALRGNMSALYNAEEQPFPFYYMHLLTLLTVLYLPLFSLTVAFDSIGEYWPIIIVGGLTVVLQAIFVIGLRLLGLRMMHPYGNDLQDLRVITYIQTSWLGSKLALQARWPDLTFAGDVHDVKME